jgi:hypothetical protein
LNLVEERPTFLKRGLDRWQRFETGYVSRWRLKAILTGGLLAMGVVALLNMFSSLPVRSTRFSLDIILSHLVAGGQITHPGTLNWFLARVALETVVGMMLLVAAGLLIANRELHGTFFGYWSLLLSLTTVNLLVFYFDQFSAIITAIVQFALLLGIIYFRHNYLKRERTHFTPNVDPNKMDNWPSSEDVPE